MFYNRNNKNTTTEHTTQQRSFNNRQKAVMSILVTPILYKESLKQIVTE